MTPVTVPVAYPSNSDTSALRGADRRKTVCNPVGPLHYEVGPDIQLAADSFAIGMVEVLPLVGTKQPLQPSIASRRPAIAHGTSCAQR